ncbi:thioredoxin family protein [Flavobacterium crassostreae]|uniref:Thioredoxin n=1 Tax=Flavobacterium crassostreae TaxID=1763534 RepID=A0A1B9E0G3_9FLAO|nr:thioredoxin family protein [Flavobacterium crassostreae]OCB75398.1 thioredoxin [Flavobacterium crassostreae]
MKQIVLVWLLVLLATTPSFGQLKTHTFQEAAQLAEQNPKPMVVFIHTSWCKYCKIMDNSTFKNKEVIAVLNANFYFISLDAQTKESITFNKHTFRFQPTGTKTGMHELATALATIKDQVRYPTLTILGTDTSIIFQQHSIIGANTLLSILDKAK